MSSVVRRLLRGTLAALTAYGILSPAVARAQASGVSNARPPRPPERKFGAYADAGSQWVTGYGSTGVSVTDDGTVSRAMASASFLDGVVRASAWTRPEGGYDCGWWQGGCYWGTNASAMTWDRVTIGPSPFGGPVTWSFSIDGAGAKGNRLGNGQWSAKSAFSFGTVDYAPPLSRLDTGAVRFEGSYELGDAPVTFYFQMLLSVSASNSAWADYSHTMRFAWQLPEGATYTSASGMFVAPAVVPGHAPVTTAPEPATWALLGAALAAVGVTARRRAVTC